MPRTLMVDGIAVELEERDLQVIERRIGALEKEVGIAKTELATAQTTAQNDVAAARTEAATAKTEVQNKDAEIATLKQQIADLKVTPKKLQEMARARAGLEVRAKALLDAVVLEDKGDEDIRRQVVNAKMGDTAKGWTDDMIAASFNTLAAPLQHDSGNGLGAVVDILRSADSGGSDPRAKAYSDYETAISNRWKTAGVRNSA